METKLLILGGIILLLIICSAFFSGAETALTAASRPRMHALERHGNRRAARVNRLREHMERVIGATLLGNNAVNILASALATGLFISAFGDRGVAYATVIMTALVLIFAEVLPKTFAINNADRTALAVAPVLQFFVTVMGPLVRLVQIIVRLVLRMIGVPVRADFGTDSTEEELRGAIDLHADSGEEVRHAGRMLHSILDLDDVEVSEIMIHRKDVATVDVDQPNEKIVQEVLASPYTRLPLWRGEPDNIIGVLHTKALFRAVQASGRALPGIEVANLAAPPWFIPDTTTLLAQLQAFRDRHEHFALVVDEYGALMGVVTLEDILEEIVGEISDEHDVAVPGVQRQEDGSLVVEGKVTLRDLNREFNWRLPDEEASTIAGLVLHEARRIPDKGQVFVFHGLRIEVLERQRHQITLLRLTPLAGTPALAEAGVAVDGGAPGPISPPN
jgi:magnesium and cobalt exporter, CNNM family